MNCRSGDARVSLGQKGHHMTQATLLEHVTKTIVERFRPKRIMVFGSHARGEAGPDSDLDLFIEMDTPHRPPDRAIAISEVFGLRPWPMDIVVYTPEEVRRLRHVNGTLLSVIEKEGKVLYEQR
jgi:predicted nucleotidyltransferase